MEDKICQYNQSGFCKFKNSCKRKHDDEICSNVHECRVKTCTKRHPKKCKRFEENGKCFYKDDCAYLHREGAMNQDKLMEMIGLCMVKHETEIKILNEEVKHLKDVIQNMTEKTFSFEKNEQSTNFKSVTVNQKEMERNKDSHGEKENDSVKTDFLVKCDLCSYQCEKQITLKKHMNTKHMDQIKNGHQKQIDVIENVGKAKFYCDQCNYSCNLKKGLKKHKTKCDQEQVQMKEVRCEECDMKFQSEKDLKAHTTVIHMYNSGDSTSVCVLCSKQETCEACIETELDEWIAYGEDQNMKKSKWGQ